jgi:hypothetical protein
MNKPSFRIGISTSLVFGSTLAACLSAVACSSSSDNASPQGAGGDDGATGGARSSGGSPSIGSGGAASGGATSGGGGAITGSPGAGGATPGTGGGGYAGNGGHGDADGCVPETLTAPSNVPTAIQVPNGATLIHHFHALGTQNYRCKMTASGGDASTTYAWVFIAPEAELRNDCGAVIGTHYAGSGGAATPRWQVTADGSFVQGVKVQASPVAGSIPELLLAATETTPGAFADVTYVQRLATAGGAAPGAAECTAATTEEVKKSGYSAEYYFYAGGADGGAH